MPLLKIPDIEPCQPKIIVEPVPSVVRCEDRTAEKAHISQRRGSKDDFPVPARSRHCAYPEGLVRVLQRGTGGGGDGIREFLDTAAEEI